MHATAALAATLAAAASVHAFRGTYPVVAWSPNGHLPSLPELDAVSSTPSPAAQQQHFETSNGDLCQLDALYIVSVPGLHASDLAAFPSASATSGFRASLAEAQASGAARTAPYVSDRLAVPPVGKIARRFARCGAGKGVQFTRFDDLISGGEGALTGVSSEEEWRAAMLALLDSQIAEMLASAPESSAFVLTDLPYKLSSASPKLAKRQQLMPSDTSEETIEEVLEEIAEEEDVSSNALDEMLAEIESAEEDHSAPSMSAEDEADPYASLDRWDGRILDVSTLAKNASKNGTSIFAPDEHSGLLHRYALFSPSLIVAILVTVVVLIPTVLVGTQALLSIETVNGLETKMTGSVGLDPSKQ